MIRIYCKPPHDDSLLYELIWMGVDFIQFESTGIHDYTYHLGG